MTIDLAKYYQFLESKIQLAESTGFEAKRLNSKLFDFQKYIVERALHYGKYCIFAECGLGKTPMQLEYDLGNCKSHKEFFEHLAFLSPELYRILQQGRLMAVHCMDLPIKKEKDGYIGLRDFSGMLIKAFESVGFIYHDRVTIWKDPVVEMQRTKALGWSNKGDVVFSPFGGIGSEGYMSVKLDRKFIGIELKESYYREMCRNLKNAELKQKQLSIL